MNLAREKHFRQGLQYLDDIQRLSEQNISPLVRQAIFNFSRAQQTTESTEPIQKQYPKIWHLFESYLERYRLKILQQELVEQVELTLDPGQDDLKLIDRVFDSLGLVVDVACCFTCTGVPELKISQEGIEFTSEVILNEDIEGRRTQIYARTRALLSRGMILTFDHHAPSEGQKTSLKLSLSFPESSGRLMLVDLTEKASCLLGFSALFDRYRLADSAKDKLGRHLCIEITEELKVEKYTRLPKRVLSRESQYDILHFAFLFRPVSLIIPRRGSVIHERELKAMLGGTGCGNENSQQDVEKSERNYFFLDLLSLMSS